MKVIYAIFIIFWWLLGLIQTKIINIFWVFHLNNIEWSHKYLIPVVHFSWVNLIVYRVYDSSYLNDRLYYFTGNDRLLYFTVDSLYFCSTVIFFFFFFAHIAACGNLSCLTREGTSASSTGMQVLTTALPWKSLYYLLYLSFCFLYIHFYHKYRLTWEREFLRDKIKLLPDIL